MTGAVEQGAVARAWAQVRGNLRQSAGARVFDRWLKPMVLLADGGADADTVRLGLPSAFMTNWVRNNFADRLALEFRMLLPAVASVTVETVSDAARIEIPAPAETPAAPVTPVAAERRPVVESLPPVAAAPEPAPQPAADLPLLDAAFRFDRFVTHDSNQVALNAARAIAEAGRPRFSPLFLHGATGQGKTHLLHAIGHAHLQANPGASVIYLPAERFMFEFVAAMRARDTHAFKARLRGADLLLVDDLQFIIGKDATQEEFFHTVNAFMHGDKRLVIACDRAPTLLEGVEQRLASRLGAGLVVDVKPAGLPLRRAILAQKLRETPAVPVADEICDLIAERIGGSVRELEGALNRLLAYAQLTGQAVTMDFALSTLGEALAGPARRVSVEDIQRAVSAHFEVKPLDLLSARRAVAIARPRQIAMYLSKRLTTRSLPEIGRKFGNRDHSTVIHAVRRIEELRTTDRDVDNAVRALTRQLEG